MRLNVVFTLSAIYLALVSIATFLAPAVPAIFGTADATASFIGKIATVTALGLAIIAWLVRNAEPSKTRNSLVLGYTILFAAWAVVSVYGQFALPAPANRFSWVQALIQGLLAVGFIVAGRSSMAESAS